MQQPIPAVKRILTTFGAFCAVAAQGGADVDREESVEPDGVIRIENVRGEIEVEGWAESKVAVVGELDDLARDLVIRVDGRRTLIRVELPRAKRGRFWGDGSDLKIRVPRGSRVHVEGAASDVSVSNVAAPVMVRTVAGDVELDDLVASVSVRTVSGDVSYENGTGTTKVMTTSGDIDLEIDSRELLVHSVSGSVRAELDTIHRLVAETVNGRIEVDGRLADEAAVRGHSVNGKLTLALDDVPANVLLRAGAGGRIESELLRGEAGLERRRLTGDKVIVLEGPGTSQVNLETVNGEIRLEKR